MERKKYAITKSGRIKSPAFGLIIVLGAIAGAELVYAVPVRAGQPTLAFILGISMVFFSYEAVSRATSVSSTVYLFSVLGSMGIPIIGGIAMYLAASKHNLVE